eukprot:11204-Heterococcus_DN1.PRE.1
MISNSVNEAILTRPPGLGAPNALLGCVPKPVLAPKPVLVCVFAAPNGEGAACVVQQKTKDLKLMRVKDRCPKPPPPNIVLCVCVAVKMFSTRNVPQPGGTQRLFFVTATVE